MKDDRSGRPPLPGHLLHVGFPKAASTFLQNWFSTHPEIAFRRDGIGGFSNIYEVAADAACADNPPAWRVTSFECLITPIDQFDDFDCRRGHRLVPKVGRTRRVIRTLKTLFPDARVLLITRGYRTLLMSLYSELVRGGASCDLATYAAGQAELARRGLSPFDYDRVIADLTHAFGPENVIILPFELLQGGQGALTSALERELGVGAHPAPSPAWPSLSPSALHWAPRVTRAILSLPFGETVRGRLLAAHVRRARTIGGGRLLRTLERLAPAVVGSDDLPEEAIEAFRGTAKCLGSLPHYERLAREYLLES